MFCENCGNQLGDNDSFCCVCGNAVAPAVSLTVTPVSSPAPSPAPDPFTPPAGSPAADSFAPPARPPAADPFAPPAPPAPDPNGFVPQIPPQGTPPKKKIAPSTIVAIVLSAIAIIAIILLVVFLVIKPFSGDDADTSSPSTTEPSTNNTSDTTQQTRAKELIDLFISQVDNADYPKVTLYARIADDAGTPIDNPDPSYFVLTEIDSSGDEYIGTIDEIASLAVGDAMNINLVIDQSGSMSQNKKMTNAKIAAESFVDEIVKTDGNVAEITSFDDNIYNMQPFTSSESLLDSSIESLTTSGETALYDALCWALRRTNLRSGSRVVIAFTDGQENASTHSLQDVVNLSEQTGIPVYIVGIGDDVDRSSLKSLASKCNGQYFDAATSNLAQALQEIYQSIYDDQRSLFKIVYESSCSTSTSNGRTITIGCTSDGPYEGSATKTYVPVDNVSIYDDDTNSPDYVLADSSSRYYSKSELEDLSLWELYLARNEIFARYGRGFKNRDLTEYFATRSWYQQRYTPEEFEAMPSPLNDYEMKNTELMLEIEKSKDSPYLYTANN